MIQQTSDMLIEFLNNRGYKWQVLQPSVNDIDYGVIYVVLHGCRISILVDTGTGTMYTRNIFTDACSNHVPYDSSTIFKVLIRLINTIKGYDE